MSPKRLFTVGTSVCLLLIGCACSPKADQKAEAEKINKLNQEWTSGIKNGNADKIVGLFAEKPVSMIKGEPLYTDLTKIRKGVNETLADPLVAKTFSLTSDSLMIAASGDLAFNWGTQKYQVTSAAGPMEISGKWITLWKKIDGNWKVILDFGNDINSMNPPTSSASLVEELTQVEQKWNEATLKKDTKAMDLILAQEYTYTDEYVELSNKEQCIQDLVTGKTAFLEPATLSDLKVTQYGPIAVVRGKNTLNGKLSGQRLKGTFSFVDVFVWRDGRWQCVSTK